MRKVVANLFISLDGVVESPEQWSMSYWNDEIQEAVSAGMAASDAMLLGRVTYEAFAQAWSGMTTDDDAGADHMNNTRKYVASTTLTSTDWNNSTLLSGDLAEEVTKLKGEPGGDIMTSGSPTLVHSLLDHGLVDELHLLLYPVLVGRGKGLFQEAGAQVPLTLKQSTAFSNGVVHLVYGPAEPASAS